MAIANIQDVRQKYPDYNDLSDQELADKLHDKFYSDMPKEDFYNKIGFSQNSPLLDYLKKIKDYVPKTTMPAGLNIVSGLMGLAGKTPEQSELIKNLPQIMEGKQPTISENIEKGIGEYAPFGAIGGQTLLGQLGAGALYGAKTANPKQENLLGYLPKGRIGGAIESAGINALTHGLGKGIEFLRPSNLLRGNLSPQELQKNMEAAAGNHTALGDVIGSPFLKRQYENIISKMPFSGATEKLQQTGQAVEKRGNDLLAGILGVNNPDTVTDDLTKALINKHNVRREIKNSFYDESNKLADDSNLQLPLTKFSNVAKQYKSAIDQTNILKFEPELAGLLRKLNIYESPTKTIESSILSAEGQPIKSDINPKLKEANILKGKLNELSEQYKISPNISDRMAAGVFSNLSRALRSDIQTSIKNSGNKELQSAYNTAEDNYQKNYSKYLDKDIYKYLAGKDPDTITQNFVKVSQGADRSKALSKLTSVLSDKERKLLQYSYFSRAVDNEGNFNPAKLSTLIRNLGKNQFKTLVPEKTTRDQLRNFNRLYQMNTKAVNLMQNPATGQQGMDIIPALLAHAGSGLAGGMVGHIPGAIAGLMLPGIATKPLVHYMTDPSIRENLIKAMIAKKPMNKNIVPAIQTGVHGITNR